MPVTAIVYVGHSGSDLLNVLAYSSRALMNQILCAAQVQMQIQRNHKTFGHIRPDILDTRWPKRHTATYILCIARRIGLLKSLTVRQLTDTSINTD